MAARKKSGKANAMKERADVPRTEKVFMVRHGVPGATYGDVPLESGRVIRMHGFMNDQTLLRQEFITELTDPASVQLSECGGCGGQFISVAHRDGHYRRTHKDLIAGREQTIHDMTETQRQRLLAKEGTFGPNDVGFTPQTTPSDREDEAIIERENEVSPLNLEKTAASRT